MHPAYLNRVLDLDKSEIVNFMGILSPYLILKAVVSVLFESIALAKATASFLIAIVPEMPVPYVLYRLAGAPLSEMLM